MQPTATLKTRATPTGEYVGLKDASDLTGIPESTLRAYVASGRLTGYRIPSRRLWFKPSDLDGLYVKVEPKH